MFEKKLFADVLLKIHYAGGMVRWDLGTYDPVGDGQTPVPVEDFRLTMPLRGFLSTVDAMQKMIDRMEQAGLVKKNPVPVKKRPVEKLDN